MNTIPSINKNFATKQLLLAFLGAIFTSAVIVADPMFSHECCLVLAIFVALFLVSIPAVWRQRRFLKLLMRPTITFMTIDELSEVLSQSIHKTRDRFLGWAFSWEPEQRQQADELTNVNWQDFFAKQQEKALLKDFIWEKGPLFWLHPKDNREEFLQICNRVAQTPGYRWIHLLGKEKPRYVTENDLAGHMAVFGTTGAGKSRFLELQILQAIFQNQTVIVLDPKGDQGLEKHMQEACQLCGRVANFLRFHLAHPEQSVGLNLLANYSRAEDLASRITNCIPSGGGESQAFIAMGRQVLSTICQGLDFLKEKPSFKAIHYYFNHREELACKVIRHWLHINKGGSIADNSLNDRNDEDELERLIKLLGKQTSLTPLIVSVISLAQQADIDLMKRTVSTFNVVESLASGAVGDLLDPEFKSTVFDQSTTNTQQLVDQNCVIYIGLDALSNADLASQVGSMFLSDLGSLAGSRYNFQQGPESVALFVDEAAELMCEPFVQMLNKSRGAGFKICIATQTVADFVAKAGNKDSEAKRILANTNNVIVLRCNDLETQKFISERLDKTNVEKTTFSHNVMVTADSFASTRGSLNEQKVAREADLIPAQLLGSLPNLEFFGIVAGGHVIKGRIPVIQSKEKTS